MQEHADACLTSKCRVACGRSHFANVTCSWEVRQNKFRLEDGICKLGSGEMFWDFPALRKNIATYLEEEV